MNELSYPKFQAPPYKFLFLKYDYFLQTHLLAELRREGHEVRELPPPSQPNVGAVFADIVAEAQAFRPDALLVLNNMGLDHHGVLLTELDLLGLPVIIWYLDNYRTLGPILASPAPDRTLVFSCDQAMVPELKKAGFPHVHYLPLATDLTYSTIGGDERYNILGEKVTFVGNTFTNMVKHFHSDSRQEKYENWNPDFLASRKSDGGYSIEKQFAPFRDDFGSDGFENTKAFHEFIAYAIFRQTRRYRVALLTALIDAPLLVFGDDNWDHFLPANLIAKSAAYHTETPNVYRYSAINLSMATFQLESALNQRLFDVPLCRGFLLTDHQESLGEHFEIGTEVITYEDADDLKEKVTYYLGHPSARKKVIDKAQERVFKEHLMEHRVDKLLNIAKQLLA